MSIKSSWKRYFKGQLFCDEIYAANLSLVVLKSAGIVLVKSQTAKSRPSEACSDGKNLLTTLVWLKNTDQYGIISPKNNTRIVTVTS